MTPVRLGETKSDGSFGWSDDMPVRVFDGTEWKIVSGIGDTATGLPPMEEDVSKSIPYTVNVTFTASNLNVGGITSPPGHNYNRNRWGERRELIYVHFFTPLDTNYTALTCDLIDEYGNITARNRREFTPSDTRREYAVFTFNRSELWTSGNRYNFRVWADYITPGPITEIFVTANPTPYATMAYVSPTTGLQGSRRYADGGLNSSLTVPKTIGLLRSTGSGLEDLFFMRKPYTEGWSHISYEVISRIDYRTYIQFNFTGQILPTDPHRLTTHTEFANADYRYYRTPSISAFDADSTQYNPVLILAYAEYNNGTREVVAQRVANTSAFVIPNFSSYTLTYQPDPTDFGLPPF